MTAKTNILFLGATGYLGGAVLARLIAHPSFSTFEITAIVRQQEKTAKLEKLGVKTVVGSFKTDLDVLEKLAANSHVVFNCADADDLAVAEAILRGLKSRHTKTGDLPIFIHTSGTGILTAGQETNGMAATDVIFDDLNADQLETLPPTGFHRNVDFTIANADNGGYVRTYRVYPSTIYGIAPSTNPLVSIMNPQSIQIPALIKVSLARGRAGVVGKGLSLWPDVHIDDQADLYINLYDAIVANPDKVGHGREGVYYGENGEHSWADISRAIGSALVAAGVNKEGEAEPTAFSDEELVMFFGSLEVGHIFGTNSRARGNRSRAIGWKPKYTREDMIASIKPELEYILKAQEKK